MSKKVIWYDFTNVPHVSFLYPIFKHFETRVESVFTIRDFAETKGFFEKKFNVKPFIVGKHGGRNKLMKVLESANRLIELNKTVQPFDIKISVGGDASSILSKLKGKFSITFDDNEKAPNWRYSKFSDLAFWPRAVPIDSLTGQGFRHKRLFRYDGFKEDMYIADYIPDKHFMNLIPFSNYVLLRPENIQANYVSRGKSIAPELIRLLTVRGYNIVYLPRYDHDRNYVQNNNKVFIPEKPINGLDACYYADCVLTGAGTLAREAACLGVPSVSFYAGRELLAVDQYMIKNKWIYFSRKPEEIVKSLTIINKREPDLARARNVKAQIIERLSEII